MREMSFPYPVSPPAETFAAMGYPEPNIAEEQGEVWVSLFGTPAAGMAILPSTLSLA